MTIDERIDLLEKRLRAVEHILASLMEEDESGPDLESQHRQWTERLRRREQDGAIGGITW